MLMVVSSGDELDKIDDYIDNIESGNKIMLSLYDDIQHV